MKKAITLVFAFFYLAICYSQGIAPSVINSAGGSFQAGYNQYEWSIGEMALVGQMKSPDNSLVVTNGFIQPYILYPAAYNPQNLFGDDEIKIFPNPVSTYVEINFFTKQKGRITIDFYDPSGKKVYSEGIIYYGVGQIERISVSKLPSEVYFVHINLDPFSGYISKKGIYKIVKVR